MLKVPFIFIECFLAAAAALGLYYYMRGSQRTEEGPLSRINRESRRENREPSAQPVMGKSGDQQRAGEGWPSKGPA